MISTFKWSGKFSFLIFHHSKLQSRSSSRARVQWSDVGKGQHSNTAVDARSKIKTHWEEAAEVYFGRGGEERAAEEGGILRNEHRGDNSPGHPSKGRFEIKRIEHKVQKEEAGNSTRIARKDCSEELRSNSGSAQGKQSRYTTTGEGASRRSMGDLRKKRIESTTAPRRQENGDHWGGQVGDRSRADSTKRRIGTTSVLGRRQENGDHWGGQFRDRGRADSTQRRIGTTTVLGRQENGDDWRWQSRERFPKLAIEGQPIYGVTPILSAVQASRRSFYSLYMQENLFENMDRSKRKDKGAVSFIEKAVKDMGLPVKTASKHDLNMLSDNRPHQGLVLDASPLELIPVLTLEPPIYAAGKTPVWVALDEVTDPQNFGAILRSAYYLGAEGVVVCAKNSAPVSGVVSKASAGALEVMEVKYCRNMMKFLDGSRENGWRVLGASAEHGSVPVRGVPRGIATILVLGNEGTGLRTNVRRTCDQLVSIAGISRSSEQAETGLMGDFVVQEDAEEEGFGLDNDENDEDVVRRGAEVGLMTGPYAVDSLNVSVACGVMLYELMADRLGETS